MSGPTGDLFAGMDEPEHPPRRPQAKPVEADEPLAARMRPASIDEFEGQQQLLDPGRALRAMLDRGTLASMILWGPPGSGKTTLAHLLASATDATFVQMSAVAAGVKQIREVTAQARERLSRTGRRTVLFCDEIHRFNKGQQDAFLPHVEDGTIVLIGATTENPSFELVRPLLSRAPVYVLEPLGVDAVGRLLASALADAERGLGGTGVTTDSDAIAFIAEAADGDARRALGVLEAAAALVGAGGRIDMTVAREALQHRFAAYDKGGESHYNLISALHKSIRGSDPDGSLYWLARMLEAGEDPMYLARRLVRIASEDIGLADPSALRVTVAARDAYHFLGSPEGDLALAQACLYLATAPKSNRAYRAFSAARQLARDTPAAPVPIHLRNAPTTLMKDLGYGDGYRYDPDEPEGVANQRYLPEGVDVRPLYEPTDQGYEGRVAQRLNEWAEARRRRNSDAADR
jgi:putative ATPase